MRRTPLKRRTPLRRKKSEQERAAELERIEQWQAMRTLVYIRSGGVCDLCGHGVGPAAFDVHHRLPRSRGGQDTGTNLVCLHRPCHAYVHREPLKALRLGFTVPTWAQPDAWPFRLRRGMYVQPNDTGWETADPLFEQLIGRYDDASRPRYYRPGESTGASAFNGSDDVA